MVLSHLPTRHQQTAQFSKKLLLLVMVMVLVEFPMEDLASVREDHEDSSKDRFNQGKSVLIAEIRVPA